MRERELLQHIYQANESLSNLNGSEILIPPGDDMALIGLRESQLLAAVDQVIDGVHVELGKTPMPAIGRKAMTRCLSDLAAMVGTPVASLATAALPPSMHSTDVEAIFDAMRATAEAYRCPLIGGDIAVLKSESASLVLTVTVLGHPGPSGAVRRSGARVGDGMYVTGELGGAWSDSTSGHHLTFEPRIDVALALSAELGDRLHAMIDVSDGLASDAGHLAAASGYCIEIDVETLPLRVGSDWRAGLGDGEDYELCFAAEGDVPGSFLGVPVTRVGSVHSADGTAGSCGTRIVQGATLIDPGALGWEHGATESP